MHSARREDMKALAMDRTAAAVDELRRELAEVKAMLCAVCCKLGVEHGQDDPQPGPSPGPEPAESAEVETPPPPAPAPEPAPEPEPEPEPTPKSRDRGRHR